jgi:hypothetical protein
MKNRKAVAELRPVEVAKDSRLRDLPGILSSLPHLSPADIDAFESDLMPVSAKPPLPDPQREPTDLAGAAESVLKKNGDYTQEREVLFGDLSLDQILAAMKRQRP